MEEKGIGLSFLALTNFFAIDMPMLMAVILDAVTLPFRMFYLLFVPDYY